MISKSVPYKKIKIRKNPHPPIPRTPLENLIEYNEKKKRRGSFVHHFLLHLSIENYILILSSPSCSALALVLFRYG